MSVTCVVIALTQDEASRLEALDHEEGMKLLYGNDRDGWLDDLERALHLEKWFQPVQLILCGEEKKNALAMLFDESAGRPLEIELTYGPLRLFDAEHVRQMAEESARLSDATVADRLRRSDAFLELYPFSTRKRFTNEDAAMLHGLVREFRAFVARRASRGHCLAVGFE